MARHFLMLLTFIVLLLQPTLTLAQAATPGPVPNAGVSNPSNVCTSFLDRSDVLDPNNPPTQAQLNSGFLTQIERFIKSVVLGSTKQLFTALTSNASYQAAVNATMVLFATIYGLFFMLGIAQASLGQVLIRLIKMGLIYTLISPAGWEFFNDYVVAFFVGGTDQIIRAVITTAAGGAPLPANFPVFYQLDQIGQFLIHPETIAALIGSATSGPYSLGMTGLMMVGFFGFIGLLVKALRIYATAFVAQAMLLGLAPIFFIFLLFERTKNLFNSWLNVLIGLSLQPILFFTFLAFMLVMIETATKNMMSVELCWVPTDAGQGFDAKKNMWRFMDADGTPMLQYSWQGSLQCTLDQGTSGGSSNCPQFPFKIIDVLTFLLLVWLSSRFAEVTDRIASELSSTFLSLDPAGKLAQYLSEAGSGGKNDVLSSVNSSAAGKEVTPQPSPQGTRNTNAGSAASTNAANNATSTNQTPSGTSP
jgi:type IV secretory pathway VirB6-like protein